MKRIIALLLCLTILLAGCGIQQEAIEPGLPEDETITNVPEVTPSETETEPEEATLPMELLAVSVPAVRDVFSTDDGTELFSYTSQHMQLIFPDAYVA